jgi:hypothetical protein
MPSFFIPLADSPEQAKRVYEVFLKQNPYAPKAGRLYKVSFRDHGKIITAQVGDEELVLPPERCGLVLAIVETERLVTIHTQLRGALSASPILVSPGKLTERVYFDDYPEGNASI